MGPTLMVKQCLCNWKVLGSNPSGVKLQDYRQDQGHHGKFFFGFFCFGFEVITAMRRSSYAMFVRL